MTGNGHPEQDNNCKQTRQTDKQTTVTAATAEQTTRERAEYYSAQDWTGVLIYRDLINCLSTKSFDVERAL